MTSIHDKTFPGEGSDYRKRRNELLEAEIELRAKAEEVAALRRRLPMGGPLKQDYVFQEPGPEGGARDVSFSDLFSPGKDTLLLYNFMYGPDWEKPCPMCTAVVDGFNGNAQYLRERVDFALVAKADIRKIAEWAKDRSWKRIRLLSSKANSFNADYNAEFPSKWGDQHPILHVFSRKDGEIRHFWSSELAYAPSPFDPRHLDLAWPLWSLLDTTPAGRGVDWYPSFQK